MLNEAWNILLQDVINPICKLRVRYATFIVSMGGAVYTADK